MRKFFPLFAAALAILTMSQGVGAQSDLVNGQVTKIDESANKITMRHGPMPKFELDEGHTMVFRVQDPAIFKQVKVGDKVKFEADRVNGQFVVMKIQKAK
jgi:Cu(I)/Ag(I) efflux system protein CusF